MSAVIVETSDRESPEPFAGSTADLLAFLSFGAAERYGSTHELSALARLLRRKHRIDTRPLFEFGDADPEDDEDRRLLERLWVEATPLAEACAAVAAAIRDDPELAALARDFPALPQRLDEIAAMARRAATRGARLRVTYRL
jgi:hypothetical protein